RSVRTPPGTFGIFQGEKGHIHDASMRATPGVMPGSPAPSIPNFRPMPTLVFTGGGTAGHVMPNLALAPRLREQGWTLHYIGSAAGPERTLAEGAGIPFHAVATGKLRRYFSWRNF